MSPITKEEKTLALGRNGPRTQNLTTFGVQQLNESIWAFGFVWK
jgi:hypothetical protein